MLNMSLRNLWGGQATLSKNPINIESSEESTQRAINNAVHNLKFLKCLEVCDWRAISSCFGSVRHDLKSVCLLADIHFCVGADDRNLAEQTDVKSICGPTDSALNWFSTLRNSSWPSILTASAASGLPFPFMLADLCFVLCWCMLLNEDMGPGSLTCFIQPQNVSTISTFKQLCKINNDCTASWAQSFE